MNFRRIAKWGMIVGLAWVTTGLAQDRVPVRLLAEAEDFQVKSGEWALIPYKENYYASTFAITFLSRMACLGAPAQVEKAAVAEMEVEIPYADSFQVAARYEQPCYFSCEFTIEIVQNKKVVYQQVFGRLEDPKIWALNGHKRLPMERFWWGGTDNIVWQMPGESDPSKMVKLAAGKATLRLIAGPQMEGKAPREMAAERHVDVVCLTNDKEGLEAQKKTHYLEMDGWLTQDGDLFARFTNPRNSTNSCLVTVPGCGSGQHSPYYVHIRDWPVITVGRTGMRMTALKYQNIGPRVETVKSKNLAALLPATNKVDVDEYLKPGERSGWVPIGMCMDALNNCVWAPGAQSAKGGSGLQIEFGVPDGRGGVKSIGDKTWGGKSGGFEIPGNVAAHPVIRSQQESLKWLTDQVNKFPRVGSVAKRFYLYSILGFGAGLNWDEGKQLALALGDNTAVGSKGKTGMAYNWRPNMAEYQKADADGKLKDLYVVSYGDEMHIPASAPTDEELAVWLKAHHVKIEGPVKYTTDTEDPLYYYSQICATERGGQSYIEASQFLADRGVLAGANYSPHANYIVSDQHWVRPFKMKALTMPWSEDYVWQIPEFSVQVVGYMVSAFRAGAKYHQQPIHMYVMPHSPGNTPSDFRRSFYTCVGQGSKMINYFCASPMSVGGTENYVATEDLDMWRAIYDVSHQAGIFEDYVMDGQVRPAQVGLLLSSVDEILSGDSNSKGGHHNQERKALYYALRHSQIPVDFLTEDDVIDGLAKDYKVIYIFQQYLGAPAVRALTRWTEAGGTVVALCGGGFMDEFKRDNPEAHALYGVKTQSLWKDPAYPMVLAKLDLPRMKPVDQVAWRTGDQTISNIDVVVWKQSLVVDDGEIMGTFRNGQPAVVSKSHGKGKAVLFGFFPGMAYLKSGLPLRPVDRGSSDKAYAHFLPTKMDPVVRSALTDHFMPAGFIKPVECSETLVESICIDTEKPAQRLAVTLINYTGTNLTSLSVKVNGLSKVKSVKSVMQGKIKPVFQDGAMVVTIPINEADMLLIDR